MSPENKKLLKKKKLKEKKNRPDEIEAVNNFNSDSTQQRILSKKTTTKNKLKSEFGLKKKKMKMKCDKSTAMIKEGNIQYERRMKTKKRQGSEVDSNDSNDGDGVAHEGLHGENKGPAKEKKSKLGLKKKRKREVENDVSSHNEDQIHVDDHPDGNRSKSDHAQSSTQFETLKESGNLEKPRKAINGIEIKSKKVKKEMKRKKKDFVAKKGEIEQTLNFIDEENVEEISSVDEDCSRGMRKWLIKYKESRPGLNILQDRIDKFITAYEEQQEQERKEREARAAEGGWTVVVHHKGRKKTTEAETGVAVGSVSEAVVVDKMSKKKNKEVPLDFYRFKKREAQRNEIMMQQNKFEQDKKRIQQLRSARKFRPY